MSVTGAGNEEKKLNTGVAPLSIEKELKTAFLDYAMSVIVSRALPDVRDGLKPVHRRILYAMHDLGLYHERPYRKSATVVGEVMGHYHPHGDSAIYMSMVGMVQLFSKRYPLLDGQGNWGSIDGDNPAAMRYCIVGDSLILTNEGIVPIASLSAKNEEDINLKVISYEGKTQQATKFFNSGKHPVLKLTTVQGYSISGSYNHPVLCWVLNQFGMPSIQWKFLEDVKPGDYVVLARNQNLFSQQNPDLKKYYAAGARNKAVGLPKEMTSSLAFLLGALVSEGSFHQKQILFCNQDKSFYKKCKDAFSENFEGISFYEREIQGDCLEFAVYLQNAVNFLQNIGLKNVKSAEKEIPFIILKSKKNIIKSFLQALFEGDGSVVLKKDKRHGGGSIELTYNSKSKKLIDQLKIVLLNFGIVTTAPYQDKRNGCYKLIISGVDNIYKFYEEIGFYSARKQNIIKGVLKLNTSRMSKTDFVPYLAKYIRQNYKSSALDKYNFDRYNKLDENYELLKSTLNPHDLLLVDWIKKQNYFFNQVEKKEALPEEEVFSVRVNSTCHSFVANGFINHNTEVRMARLARELLADIEKNTVLFVPNFDESHLEPSLLPSKIPNLLINGSTGIAVGMATSMPPHNLTEVINACIAILQDPGLSEERLFELIPAPDFPTGGIICGRSGIVKAYRTGHGQMIVRGVVEVEEGKKHTALVITELPYQVNKADLITKIADLTKEKTIEGISNIRDESDRDGIRVVIELRRGEDPNIVLNGLYKHTSLQSSMSIIMLALYQNRPMFFTLREMIEHFLLHRREVITRRSEFDLAKNKARMHVLDGVIIALNNIDEVIALIKKSQTAEEATVQLNARFALSPEQSKAILEMRLQRLTGLEREKIRTEIEELKKIIAKLELILCDEAELKSEITKELEQIKTTYSDARRTRVEGAIDGFSEADLIPDEEVLVTLTHKGYIKRVLLDTYAVQHRGGKGKKGMADLDDSDDIMQDAFATRNHDDLLFFTNHGRIYSLKVYQVPEASRTAKGRAIINILQLNQGERVVKLLCARDMENKFMVMITRTGTIKKTDAMEFAKIRSTGIRAINLDEGDELAFCSMSSGNDTIIIATHNGQGIHFKETEVRSMGRNAAGVRGITLRDKDHVVGLEIVPAGAVADVLFATSQGYGKRVNTADFRVAHRGGVGVRTIPTAGRNGYVIGLAHVSDESNVLLIDSNGKVIRLSPQEVRTMGRQAKGVRLVRLDTGQDLAAMVAFEITEEIEQAAPAASDGTAVQETITTHEEEK